MRNHNGHPQNSKLAIYSSGSPSLNPRRTNATKQEHDQSGKMIKQGRGDRAPFHTRKLHRYGMLLCDTIGQVGLGRLVMRFLDHKQLYTHAHKHTNTHAHTVGLLLTTAHPVAEARSYATRNKYNTRISMLSVGFEPTIPAIAELLLTPHGHREQHFINTHSKKLESMNLTFTQ